MNLKCIAFIFALVWLSSSLLIYLFMESGLYEKFLRIF